MSKCRRCLKSFDEFKMKPFFIYKYQHDKMALEVKYQEEFFKQGKENEMKFIKEKFNKSKTIRASQYHKRQLGVKMFEEEDNLQIPGGPQV